MKLYIKNNLQINLQHLKLIGVPSSMTEHNDKRFDSRDEFIDRQLFRHLKTHSSTDKYCTRGYKW